VPLFIVDTNVISYALRHDTRAALYARYLRDQSLAISFATLTELLFGARKRNWGARRLHDLDVLLRPYLVLYPDEASCRVWAEVIWQCERVGRPISENDAWIAACALRFDASLVTHNHKDFEAVPDLRIISENESFA
jgi:predicted nucleic acid-binding protein